VAGRLVCGFVVCRGDPFLGPGVGRPALSLGSVAWGVAGPSPVSGLISSAAFLWPRVGLSLVERSGGAREVTARVCLPGVWRMGLYFPLLPSLCPQGKAHSSRPQSGGWLGREGGGRVPRAVRSSEGCARSGPRTVSLLLLPIWPEFLPRRFPSGTTPPALGRCTCCFDRGRGSMDDGSKDI
jgi:hypothetical protein